MSHFEKPTHPAHFQPGQPTPPEPSPEEPLGKNANAKIEDTETENEILTTGEYPLSMAEVIQLPDDEDELDMIDYLMSHNPEELNP